MSCPAHLLTTDVAMSTLETQEQLGTRPGAQRAVPAVAGGLSLVLGLSLISLLPEASTNGGDRLATTLLAVASVVLLVAAAGLNSWVFASRAEPNARPLSAAMKGAE